jgi:hypothetical protein
VKEMSKQAGTKPFTNATKRVSDTIRHIANVILLSAALGGCSTSQSNNEQDAAILEQETQANLIDVGNVELVVDTSPLMPALNVTIASFTAWPENAAGTSQFKRHLRDAEAGYLPILLKNVLISSQQWGAIRVIPETDDSAEVQINATIIELSPTDISLHVIVADSRGKTWIDKTYRDTARDHQYMPNNLGEEDPYLDLFEAIANDMLKARAALVLKELDNILDISTLKYAIALSPESFADFLTYDESGHANLTGLPATSDTMYKRVNKIRDSEYKFVDAMDEQFDALFDKMQKSYPYWREYSYELIVYNERLGKEEKKNRPSYRGLGVVEDVYSDYREYKLNEDALRELSQSLETEIRPTVAEYEGQVIELSGTFSNQYKQWRRILQDIYQAERAVSPAIDSSTSN